MREGTVPRPGRPGTAQGDKVAVLTENCPAMVETNYACAKVGIICFPVMSRFAPQEIRYLIDFSDASALVYRPDFADMVEGMKEDLPRVRH